MNKPLVSIITPCFNGEKFVSRFLKSVFQQTHPHIELIIIDDGSTDNTRHIIQSYEPAFKERSIDFLYLLQENRGQAAAINQGLKICKGQYLTWPDSDDYLEADSLYERVLFLENNPEYGLVRSNGFFVNDNLEKISRMMEKNDQNSPNIFTDLFLQKTPIIPICFMVRTSIFLESYPNRQIHESRLGQNYQMLLPITSRSKCGYIDKDLCNVLVRADSHSRETISSQKQLQRINAVEKLIIDTFQYCKCNQMECIDQLKSHYTRKRFNLAIKENNFELLHEQYTILKKRRETTYKDTMSYYRKKYKWFDYLYKPIRFAKKMIH